MLGIIIVEVRTSEDLFQANIQDIINRSLDRPQSLLTLIAMWHNCKWNWVRLSKKIPIKERRNSYDKSRNRIQIIH